MNTATYLMYNYCISTKSSIIDSHARTIGTTATTQLTMILEDFTGGAAFFMKMHTKMLLIAIANDDRKKLIAPRYQVTLYSVHQFRPSYAKSPHTKCAMYEYAIMCDTLSKKPTVLSCVFIVVPSL